MGIRKSIVLFILILILGAFFRFYLITEIPPGLYADEAMNGNNALEAIATGEFKIFYPENNGREGLFINLQAISLAVFGNKPWALRVVSAVFGTLTILGIFLLTRELFLTPKSQIIPKTQNTNDRNTRILNFDQWNLFGIWNLEFGISRSEIIALLSSFFLASSYWHINFSRIGFRAITIPFFATVGMYYLLKGLREGKIFDLAMAGVFIGLGFHGYIAFRFIPFIIAVPIGWYLWNKYKVLSKDCFLCLIALFILITIAVASPLAIHFLQNPQDFFGRATDVSIFSASSPLKEFAKSTVLIMGMPFVRGDCNWRHNYACQPELHPIISFFFLVGIIALFRNTKYKIQNTKYILIAWLFFLSLPAILTREGLPHALRSIGIIPPIMILSGIGAYHTLQWLTKWFEKQREKWPEKISQLERLKKEITVLFILLLLLVPLKTYRDYFIRWANNPNTYFAFSTDIFNLGKFLNGLPGETKKYVVVNLPGVDVRGIPMPAQTVMFVTNTFRKEEQNIKNFVYLRAEDLDKIYQTKPDTSEKVVIALLDGADTKLINELQKNLPGFKPKAPGDFIIFQN